MKILIKTIGLIVIVILNVGAFNIVISQDSKHIEDVRIIQSVFAEDGGTKLPEPYSYVTGMSAFRIICDDGADAVCVVVESEWGIICHSGGQNKCSSYSTTGRQTTCPCDPS